MDSLNNVLFIALPYIAICTFLVGVIWRYRASGFKYSSLSSQFLEGRQLFWGSVPFHWGLLIVLLGHLIAFLFPRELLLWNSHPVRLIILEITGFAFGLSVLIGLVMLFTRRITNARLRVVTNRMDILIELLILAQVILGCWIALGYRWGSSWFASDLSPYLWSIVKFNPQIEAVAAMPLVIQLHIIGAFLILLLVPFTRLVHFIVVPVYYIWRPYQQVLWSWDRRAVGDYKSAWNEKPPKNT